MKMTIGNLRTLVREAVEGDTSELDGQLRAVLTDLKGKGYSSDQIIDRVRYLWRSMAYRRPSAETLAGAAKKGAETRAQGKVDREKFMQRGEELRAKGKENWAKLKAVLPPKVVSDALDEYRGSGQPIGAILVDILGRRKGLSDERGRKKLRSYMDEAGLEQGAHLEPME